MIWNKLGEQDEASVREELQLEADKWERSAKGLEVIRQRNV